MTTTTVEHKSLLSQRQEYSLQNRLAELLYLLTGVLMIAIIGSLYEQFPTIVTIVVATASFGILVYIVSIAGSAAIDFYNKIKDLKKSK